MDFIEALPSQNQTMLRKGASQCFFQRRCHKYCRVSGFVGIPTGTLGNGNAIVAGQYAQKEVCYDDEQVANYARLIEDPNPLHRSNIESSEKPIVHGMLVASIFSSIFGTLVPGSVYLDQALKFSQPVHIGDRVLGRIDVIRVRQWQGKQMVFCETTVRSAKDATTEHIRGKAAVWVPEYNFSVQREA